jgi:hypothetical protein
MTIDQLRILLRIEAELTELLEELRTVIAVALIDVQRDAPEPSRHNSLISSLNAVE